MINKIDINKFALFNGFSWDKSIIGKDAVFKTVNIIYGRNYSGKTTLSRIFRCVEKGEIHQHYLDASFSISLSDGKFLTQNNLNSISDDIKVRVYNTDFVKDNLSWLHNDDGTIKPFTLLGSINVELDIKIKDIEEKLGKEDEKKGLLFELSEKATIHNKTQSHLRTKENTLKRQLSEKAQRIKTNATLYNVPVYNITSINKDIPKATESSILSDEEVDNKKNLLREETKDNIPKLSESKPKFSDFYIKTNALLTKEIKPSQPIIDLINDKLLQEWTRQGIDNA